jgi:hypothetical protein
MTPLIQSSSVLTALGCAHSDLRPGDVAVYERCGVLIAHRFVAVRQTSVMPVCVIRGDRFGYPIETIPSSRILGRVVRVTSPRGKTRNIDTRSRRLIGLIWSRFRLPAAMWWGAGALRRRLKRIVHPEIVVPGA